MSGTISVVRLTSSRNRCQRAEGPAHCRCACQEESVFRSPLSRCVAGDQRASRTAAHHRAPYQRRLMTPRLTPVVFHWAPSATPLIAPHSPTHPSSLLPTPQSPVLTVTFITLVYRDAQCFMIITNPSQRTWVFVYSCIDTLSTNACSYQRSRTF